MSAKIDQLRKCLPRLTCRKPRIHLTIQSVHHGAGNAMTRLFIRGSINFIIPSSQRQSSQSWLSKVITKSHDRLCLTLPLREKNPLGLVVHMVSRSKLSLIARFVGPIWGPSGADRTQVGPMLVPWTFLSGLGSHYAQTISWPNVRLAGEIRYVDAWWCFRTETLLRITDPLCEESTVWWIPNEDISNVKLWPFFVVDHHKHLTNSWLVADLRFLNTHVISLC